MLKIFIISLARFLLSIIANIHIEGIQNIPLDQPAIITSNHIGFLDGIMILSFDEIARHPNLVVIVAEKWQEIGILRWAVGVLGWIFIDRFNPDVKSVREVLKRMKGPSLMVIAPEGTRSHTSSMIEAKPGAAYITCKTNAYIVPTAITGSDDTFLRKFFKTFKRLDIKVRFGTPYKLPPMPNNGRTKYLQDATDEIMCQIAALLPESYRGIYSGHPRLKELLSSSN